MYVDDVIEILAVNLIGTIPDDEQIVISTNQGEPLQDVNHLQRRKMSRNICQRLTGQEIPFYGYQS